VRRFAPSDLVRAVYAAAAEAGALNGPVGGFDLVQFPSRSLQASLEQTVAEAGLAGQQLRVVPL